MLTGEIKIELGGEAVYMMVTPRLFVYRGNSGVTLESEGKGIEAIAPLYADVMYCAALNWWELQGNDLETFGHKRIEFHGWAAAHPTEFGKIVNKIVCLLTGKTLAEMAKDKADEDKEAKAEESEDGGIKKKSTGSTTRQSRSFWSAIAARRSKRRG